MGVVGASVVVTTWLVDGCVRPGEMIPIWISADRDGPRPRAGVSGCLSRSHKIGSCVTESRNLPSALCVLPVLVRTRRRKSCPRHFRLALGLHTVRQRRSVISNAFFSPLFLRGSLRISCPLARGDVFLCDCLRAVSSRLKSIKKLAEALEVLVSVVQQTDSSKFSSNSAQDCGSR